jgi:hypothetical protein
VGDGKVFVMPVEEAYRVRTGESGEEVLQAHPGRGHGRGDRLRPTVLSGAMPDPEIVAPLGLVERLRAVHLEMVDAVLGGEGLERVAELAAAAVDDRSPSSSRDMTWRWRRRAAARRPPPCRPCAGMSESGRGGVPRRSPMR